MMQIKLLPYNGKRTTLGNPGRPFGAVEKAAALTVWEQPGRVDTSSAGTVGQQGSKWTLMLKTGEQTLFV